MEYQRDWTSAATCWRKSLTCIHRCLFESFCLHKQGSFSPSQWWKTHRYCSEGTLEFVVWERHIYPHVNSSRSEELLRPWGSSSWERVTESLLIGWKSPTPNQAFFFLIKRARFQVQTLRFKEICFPLKSPLFFLWLDLTLTFFLTLFNQSSNNNGHQAAEMSQSEAEYDGCKLLTSSSLIVFN